MSRAVALLTSAALGVASAAVAAAAPGRGERPGRVVRVDRPRKIAVTPVRGCLSFAMDPTRFTCFGSRPEQGERFRVVDGQGQIGMARVVKASPSVHDQCGAGVAHDVELEYEDGPPRSLSSQGLSIPVAISGIDADPSAVRLMSDPNSRRSPSGRQGENVWIALDRDGDQAADFMATAYENCEEASANAPAAPAGLRIHALCLDYWARDGSGWRLANRDRFYNCYSY